MDLTDIFSKAEINGWCFNNQHKQTQIHWHNTLWLRQNGHHIADDIFKLIFLNKSVLIVLKISLKFVAKVRINNIPASPGWHQAIIWTKDGLFTDAY